MIPYVLSDIFFAVLFLTGFAIGIRAIIRKSWLLIAGHILLIGFAAQVRPSVLPYVPVELFLFLYIWKKRGYSPGKTGLARMAAAVLLITVFAMLPSARNYINYRFFGPSDIIYKNFSNFLCRDVIGGSREYSEFKKRYHDFTLPEQLNQWAGFQSDFARRVILENPDRTASYLFRMAVRNLTAPHWHYLFKPFWISHIDSLVSHSGRPYRRTAWATAVFHAGRAFYILIYAIIAAGIIFRMKEGSFMDEALLILVVLAFIAPTVIGGGGSRMRAPVVAWVFMISHSSGVSGPDFSRIRGSIAALPASWSSKPTPRRLICV